MPTEDRSRQISDLAETIRNQMEIARDSAITRDDEIAGMFVALNRTLGCILRVMEEERPGTAGRISGLIGDTAKYGAGGLVVTGA